MLKLRQYCLNVKCVWLIWVKAIWYDHIYFGVILQWLKLKLKLKQLTKNTGHDYVYVADVQCQVMVALVTLYGFMCNIALVTFLGLQYWSASMINIYEDRKTCIFCVVSLVKTTKVSWNFLKMWSWNFTSCRAGSSVTVQHRKRQRDWQTDRQTHTDNLSVMMYVNFSAACFKMFVCVVVVLQVDLVTHWSTRCLEVWMRCRFARTTWRSSLCVVPISVPPTSIFRWSSTSIRGKLMVCFLWTYYWLMIDRVHLYFIDYTLHSY